MSTEYTTGPWHVSSLDCLSVKSYDGTVARCRNRASEYEHDSQTNERMIAEAAANAKLIAAAPDLLEALEHIIKYDSKGLGVIGEALASHAIAKATGE